jgi:hypothetical protein
MQQHVLFTCSTHMVCSRSKQAGHPSVCWCAAAHSLCSVCSVCSLCSRSKQQRRVHEYVCVQQHTGVLHTAQSAAEASSSAHSVCSRSKLATAKQ